MRETHPGISPFRRTPIPPSPFPTGEGGANYTTLISRTCRRVFGRGEPVGLLIVAGLGLLLLIAGCHPATKETSESADKPDALPVVTAAPVTLGTVLQTLPVIGSLSPLPNHEAKVNAPFAGALAGLFVQPNQNVVKGQPVAQMSTQTLMGQVQQAQATIDSAKVQVQQARITAAQQQAISRTALAQAKAQLASNEATLVNAKTNLEREQKLFQDGIVAKKDVDDAQLAVDTAQQTVNAQQQAVVAAQQGIKTDEMKRQDIALAEQQVKNAQGAFATAKAQINLAGIRAPVSGTVATVTANNGETVDTSTTLLTIVDMRDLQLSVSVPSSDLRLVHPGQTVQFTVESLPGRQFEGTVQSIGAQVDTATGTVPVLVNIPNTSHLLKDDMQITGQVIVARHPGALLVPKSAILTDPQANKPSVVVIDKDSVAHIKNVTTGLTSGDNIEIKSGLRAGDQVAISGQYALPDGTKVKVQSAKDAGDKDAS